MSVMLNLYRSEAQEGGGDDTMRSEGPFDFVAITYNHVRCGDDGPEFMRYHADGTWYEVKDQQSGSPPWKPVEPNVELIGYTDLTIVSAEQPAPLEEGDPCPSCGEPLKWDDDDRLVYCLNDWQHG